MRIFELPYHVGQELADVKYSPEVTNNSEKVFFTEESC